MLKDVAEGGVVPAFDVGLEILELLLKLIHLGSWWRDEGVPGRLNHFLEAWMCEPEGFKAEWPFGSVPWSTPLERNGPVIRS